MKVECPPTAPVLPISMMGSPAHPAGSLGKMLHQLCELAKENTRTFLLQRMSPLIGPARSRSRGSLRFDARGLDDRPPLLDVGLLHGSERLGRLLLAREKVQPQIGEPCPYLGCRQSLHSCGI